MKFDQEVDWLVAGTGAGGDGGFVRDGKGRPAGVGL